MNKKNEDIEFLRQKLSEATSITSFGHLLGYKTDSTAYKKAKYILDKYSDEFSDLLPIKTKVGRPSDYSSPSHHFKKQNDIVSCPIGDKTVSELQEICNTCYSFSAFGKALGYIDTSKSLALKHGRKIIRDYKLDCSHFTGQRWNKDNYDFTRFKDYSNNPERRPSTSSLRSALIFLRGYRCEECEAIEYNGCLIPLEIHHIDGNRFNHALDNLRLLCPNCHALTNTYKGRNSLSPNLVSDEDFITALRDSNTIGEALSKLKLAPRRSTYSRARMLMIENDIDFNQSKQNESQNKDFSNSKHKEKSISKRKAVNTCIKCGKPRSHSSKSELCRRCFDEEQRIVERPSKEELKNLIRIYSFVEIARMFNVSDNAVRKWCIQYNLPSSSFIISLIPDEEWDIVCENYDVYKERYEKQKDRHFDEPSNTAIIALYVDANKNIIDIAKMLDSNEDWITKVLKEHNIPIRKHPNAKKVRCIELNIHAESISEMARLLISKKHIPSNANIRTVESRISQAIQNNRQTWSLTFEYCE